MKRRVSKEKIFVFINILVIIAIIIVYLSRAIYYYKKTNYIPKGSNIYSTIVNFKNVVSNGEGLYELEDAYYYKGKEVNNYLFYSDILWRIVEINESTIKLISEEDLTSLVYGFDSNYENSYAFKWLNNGPFIEGLYNKESYLTPNNWCNENVDVNNYNCNEKIEALAGLLSTEEYIRAGGKTSYLNNETYWWTINTAEDSKVYYVQSEGEIENQSKTIDAYYSYGIRPMISLSTNVEFLGGDGSLDNPYKVGKNIDVEINNHSIGTYISYKGYTFRIIDQTNDYTKVMLDGYLLDENGEPVKISYNEINKYLENNFLTNFDTSELEKTKYYYGIYDSTNNYNYDFSSQNATDSYVGIPVIGDLHIVDYPSIWLNNGLTSDEKLVYTSTKIGSIFADFSTSENYVRPIICIKKGLLISGGEGTKTDPLVIGDANEI